MSSIYYDIPIFRNGTRWAILREHGITYRCSQEVRNTQANCSLHSFPPAIANEDSITHRTQKLHDPEGVE